ncbi:phage tail tape measure protein [Pseudomonas sp. PDM20]|uniref:phage tail tape measure protein n=1 Tax=Pseudomonas sp. PDM20 TaxID=2769254 RepID=UPI00177FD3BA|nr:phage tail tape measure protein [Pseudomonas sp. PDM20]MBD9685257.1 phage tail tape measure protein [Pseudomonas sp. PDM20]
MSSTASPFSIAALNQQTSATRALIPALEKVSKSNWQLAQASLANVKAIEQSPVALLSTLERLKAVLGQTLSTFIDDWKAGQQAAWKAYTDPDSRTKGVQGVVGHALENSQKYLSSVWSNGKSQTNFREFADPVLDELRGVMVREAIIGVSGLIASSDGWKSLMSRFSPDTAAATWVPASITADAALGIGLPTSESVAGITEKAVSQPAEPSIWIAGAKAAWDEYFTESSSMAEKVETLFSDALGNTQNFLIKALAEGDFSFRSLADSVIGNLGRIGMQLATSGIGQLFSMGSQMFASSGWGQAILSFFQADGGAWNQGVQMYAKGGAFRHGVVSAPTFFGATGGRLGVMGEAGPEAIMPLARASDGSLGVRTLGGGGTTVQLHAPVSIAIGGNGSDGSQIDQQALSSNLQRQLQLAAERAVAESWRPGGMSYRNARGRG